MLLKLNEFNIPMKIVYQLSYELENDPDQIAVTQALTLNESKPLMGLKGTYGLFGSLEWWESIYQGRMPLLHISGVIKKVYVAGQDEGETNNTIDVIDEHGVQTAVGIYTNNVSDIALFKTGGRVAIVYALDELKRQPAQDGSINYSKIALEMAVSL